MNRIYRILIPVGVTALLLVIVGIVAANQPLAKNLTITPPATMQSIVIAQAQSSPESTPSQPQTKETSPLQGSIETKQAPTQISASSTCGVKGSIDILVLGEGHQEPDEEEGVGVIRLVKVDFDQKKVTILGIPTHMIIRVIGKKDITLTYVYYHARIDATGNDKARMLEATNALAQSFVDHFGYIPKYYVTVNERVFSSIVDALGGINVNVPANVDGTSDNKGYFTAGDHVFSGVLALNYVSILDDRKIETKLEVGRNQRQNDVLEAILAKAQQPENWVKAPMLIEQFYNNIITDLSVKQMLDLACLYRGSDFQVEYISIPPATIMRAADKPLLPIDPLLGDFIKETMQ